MVFPIGLLAHRAPGPSPGIPRKRHCGSILDHETRDGNLLLDRVDNFLASYQEAAKEIKAIGPLNQLELEYLPEMIHMGNLSLLDWTLSDFYSTSSDPREYLKYLRHSVRLNRWLESNYQALTSCVQKHNLLP